MINYWPLIGIALVVIGFALKMNPMLVVTASAIVTGLIAGMDWHEVISTFGKAFNDNRIIAIVWIVLGLAFRLYVDNFGKYGETYGTVGGVAVLLLVFYFDALALLVGAEINSEIDFELLGVPRGSRDFTRRAEQPVAPIA